MAQAPRKRILVVDDDFLIDSPRSDALKLRLGAEVFAAPGPRSAIDLLKEHKGAIDLVVLDIMLPTDGIIPVELTSGNLRTGFELFKMIKERWPSMPILCVSRRNDSEALEDASRLGVKLFDTLSLSLQEYVNLIRCHLSEIEAS